MRVARGCGSTYPRLVAGDPAESDAGTCTLHRPGGHVQRVCLDRLYTVFLAKKPLRREETSDLVVSGGDDVGSCSQAPSDEEVALYRVVVSNRRGEDLDAPRRLRARSPSSNGSSLPFRSVSGCYLLSVTFFCVRMPSRTRISTYHSSMYSMASLRLFHTIINKVG
ncbi:hypothetical protein BDA96_02G247900 [Sorghum bicolor]|uniref:Uncharacterized protein n=2 Tax=Sorghum bicolor TaxID=4558 RepID=A0A921RRL2_SORBI|nr:hypothetical protein SORBI_3002G236900 [Sorghum bicolor]KAG0544125.1 hypothetical protein BDA96_02G247900 [Sorghum bicolor]